MYAKITIAKEQIQALYYAFDDVPKPTSIDVCPCCVDRFELEHLLSTPLKEITAKNLAGYAATVFNTSGGIDDFLYFLPRILEVSVTDPGWYPDLEITCGKLSKASWLSWAEQRVLAIRQLFDTIFTQIITAESLDGDAIEASICAFARSGDKIDRFLKLLEEDRYAKALISYYEANSETLLKGKLSSAFWHGYRQEMLAIVNWFNSPEIYARIQTAYGIE
jgi:hypothetical protein